MTRAPELLIERNSEGYVIPPTTPEQIRAWDDSARLKLVELRSKQTDLVQGEVSVAQPDGIIERLRGLIPGR